MSAICFDIGGEKCMTAVITKSQGVVTLLNDFGKRATPTMVGFNEKRRCFGDIAKSEQLSNLSNTVYGFKKLLGKRFDELGNANIDPFLTQRIEKSADGGILIRVNYMGKEEHFAPEQILGMLLGKLKTDAEISLRKDDFRFNKITECVLTVPSYFDNTQRQCMITAAEIAGMKCLGLIEDSTACALDFGFYKQAELKVKLKYDVIDYFTESINVLLIDFGHSALQVTAVNIVKGKITIKAKSSLSIGGEKITGLIAGDLCKQIEKKYGINPEKDEKAYVKLLNEVEKIKKRMSVEDQIIERSIDPLMGHDQVEFQYSRADFQSNSEFKNIQSRIKLTIKECLEKSKLVNKINAVELVGGSSRMHFFKEVVRGIFNKQADETLNQDEAVARGGAVFFAMLQPDGVNCSIKDDHIFQISNAIYYYLAIEFIDDVAPPRKFKIDTKKMQTIETFYTHVKNILKCYLVRDGIPMSDEWTPTYGHDRTYDITSPLEFTSSYKTSCDGNLEILSVFVRFDEKFPFAYNSRYGNKIEEVVQPSTIYFSPLSTIGKKWEAIRNYQAYELKMNGQDELEKQRGMSKNELENGIFKIEGDLVSAKSSELNHIVQDLQLWIYDHGANHRKETFDGILYELNKFGEALKKNNEDTLSSEEVLKFKNKLELLKSGEMPIKENNDMKKLFCNDEQGTIHDDDDDDEVEPNKLQEDQYLQNSSVKLKKENKVDSCLDSLQELSKFSNHLPIGKKENFESIAGTLALKIASLRYGFDKCDE